MGGKMFCIVRRPANQEHCPITHHRVADRKYVRAQTTSWWNERASERAQEWTSLKYSGGGLVTSKKVIPRVSEMLE